MLIKYMRELFKLSEKEYERLRDLFPNLQGDVYEDEEPENICSKATTCMVTIHKVEFFDKGCVFQCEVTLGAPEGKIVNALAVGIANEKSRTYVLPIPKYALSALFDLMPDNTVVDMRALEHLHITYGGENAMYSFLKNLGMYIEAMKGTQSVLESNLSQLRFMVERVQDEESLKKLEELENEAIEISKRLESMLPVMTEIFSRVQSKAYELTKKIED